MVDAERGLIVQDIWKGYGPVQILKGVSLRIRPGTVLALIGHNGAGKSTLLRSMSGAEVPERGTITVDGDSTPFSGPKDASAKGIGIVYQELSLIEQLTLAQNLYLGREESTNGVLSRREMNKHADELCVQYGIPAGGTTLVRDLPVAQRQLFEVVRAIDHDAKYLLLDEPTTALEEAQVGELLDVIRVLTKRGIGVLLIDHKLDEVFAIADDVVGLSSGQIVLDAKLSEISRREVVDAIVGDHDEKDPFAEVYEAEAGEIDLSTMAEDLKEHTIESFGPVVFSAHELRGNGLNGVDLQVRAGEILGIYGLVGSGRSRFLRTVYGANPLGDGRMELAGQAYAPKSPRYAIRNGVTFVSEERKSDGFIPQMNSLDNVVLPVLARRLRAKIIDWRSLHGDAETVLSQVAIRGDVRNPITSLSGGNQQKAIFARAILQAPRLLLLDEPTKGVDIGAKQEINGIVNRLAREKQVAVIVVSSEEEELMGLADNITVFRNGSCDGMVHATPDVTPKQLREMAWGDDSALTSH